MYRTISTVKGVAKFMVNSLCSANHPGIKKQKSKTMQSSGNFSGKF
jgi:hypothetical protein